MFDLKGIAERIKATAKSKHIAVKDLLAMCGLGINAISEMAKGKSMSFVNFATIAETLDCSVDYLLGRTDMPNVCTREDELSENEKRLVGRFRELDDEGQEEVLHAALTELRRIRMEKGEAA